jgi:NAD(P)-dependent dehydrogenase (short-subunit alcohol dehydrogenase family)
MTESLAGRAAIVTGAGRGLGQAIAEELARAGAGIAVLELDAGSGARTARELAHLGVAARAYHVDVSDSRQVDEAFAAVLQDFGRLDILVNNAGLSRIGPHTQDVSDEDWLTSIGTMQSGVFYCMRAAGRIMIPQRSGSVVNVSSIRGFSAMPGRMTYSPPKAAVIMMTRVASGEWGPQGVRVNAVAPGFLRTPMHERDVVRGVIDEEHYLRVIPAHRLGLPAEVGKLVVFLCSDAAAYITGSCLTIDGGLTSVVPG